MDRTQSVFIDVSLKCGVVTHPWSANRFSRIFVKYCSWPCSAVVDMNYYEMSQIPLFAHFLSCSLFSYALSSTKLQALVQATFLDPSVKEHLFRLSSRSVNFSPRPRTHTWSFKPSETAPRCLLTAYYHSLISCLRWPLCDLPLHRVSVYHMEQMSAVSCDTVGCRRRVERVTCGHHPKQETPVHIPWAYVKRYQVDSSMSAKRLRASWVIKYQDPAGRFRRKL